MATKLSNVIGAPFSPFVLTQLANRAYRSSTGTSLLGNRTNEEVLYLANKTSWVRLISSVDIVPPAELSLDGGQTYISCPDLNIFLRKFGIEGSGDYNAPFSLAKNWILEAGTSAQVGNGIDLRRGIGPNGAYGLGGTEELGYRPMPGLTSVTVETMGRLGSLRQATITFKVWNMNQLNVIEALYFRLGYSMLLEWGHTQYFNNKDSNYVEQPGGVWVSKDVFGLEAPFADYQTKESLQQAIAIKQESTSGNYDGMLGVVSNFNWAFNQEGGYDCTVRLIGLGSVIDSLRINQAYKLPEGLAKRLQTAQDNLDAFIKKQQEEIQRLKDQAAKKEKAEQGETFLPVPASIGDLYQREKQYNNKPADYTYDQYFQDYGVYSFKYFDNKKKNYIAYVNLFDDPLVPPARLLKANELYGGLWLNLTTGLKQVNPVLLYPTVTLDNSAINKFIEAAAVAPGTSGYSLKPDPTSTAVSSTSLGRFLTSNDPRNISAISIGGDGTLTVNVQGPGIKYDPATQREYTLGLNLIQAPGVLDRYYKFAENPRKTLGDAFGATPVQATITGLTFKKGESLVTVKGTFQLKAKATLDKERIEGLVSANLLTRQTADDIIGSSPDKEVILNYRFETNNPGFILDTLAPAPSQTQSEQKPENANTGDNNAQTNTADASQSQSAVGYESALHAMLVVVQTTSQEAATKSRERVDIIDIREATKLFYQDGILDGVFDTQTIADPTNVPFNLTAYAQKGFNSELMVDPKKFSQITSIDFNKFCKSVVVEFAQFNTDGIVYPGQYSTYITLGYLLAFINNMCLFYDSKNPDKNTKKRPYVYLDFNPETNLCLTSPQQFSIDPNICLIPAYLNQNQYREIFPEGIQPAEPFNPEKENYLSYRLTSAGNSGAADFSFQATNQYQGKTMNILLNTQYLLEVLKSFTTSDPEHSVNLQPFLERIMTDVSKCLGNTNLFRVAYRDDSNTIQIIDDQFTPNLAAEPTMLERSQFLQDLKNNAVNAGELPIFSSTVLVEGGKSRVVPSLSIAREFQIRSVMSTKLASMIAISAQASTGSVNAKDHSSLSYLNQNYRDRYKPYIQDVAPPKNGSRDRPSNDQEAADIFNGHVQSIYTTLNLSADKIQSSKNYYIERMSKVKSGDNITSSAPFIPVELELTLDGISGIKLMNAFSVPQSRLPLSLRNETDDQAKVAFIVNGLTHTIESNQWVTRIKAQMIKLREDSAVGKKVIAPAGKQSGVLDFTTTSGLGGSNTPRNTNLFANTNAPRTSAYLFGTAKSNLSIDAPAHPNWGGLKATWQNANAWDLVVPAGTPVYALTDGTVSGIGFYENRNTVWGYKFTLTGASNSFFYTHLDSVVVANGASVTKGQLLGYVGQWPSDYVRLSTFSHLHLGVKTGTLKTYVDNTGKLL